MTTFDKNVGGYLQKAFAEGFATHAYIVEGDKQFVPSLLKECALVTLCPRHTDDGCEVCSKVQSNLHQDVITIPRDNRAKIKVEDVAYLVEESNLKSVDNSVARVFLVDATSSVSGFGMDLWQNKLLKTIEEPTDGVYIFIGVTDADGLLPTVRSRCQVLKQTKLTNADVCNHLVAMGYDLKTCQIASSMSNGSLQMAEKMVNDSGAFEAFNTAMDILENMVSSKVALPFVSRILANKPNINNCLAFMTILLGQSLHYRIAPQLFELSALKRSIAKICQNYSIQAARVCIEKINQAKISLDGGANATIIIDTLANSILEVKFRCQL